MPNEQDAAARTIEARRRQVARFYSGGYSVREMQVELAKAGFKKVSRSTVYGDLTALKDEWRKANVGVVEEQRAKHMQRIDADLAHLTRQSFRITEPVAAAKFYAETILPLLKERAKLLGLYAPKRVDITEYVRNWAREQGFDPEMAVKLAQDVVDSTGF